MAPPEVGAPAPPAVATEAPKPPAFVAPASPLPVAPAQGGKGMPYPEEPEAFEGSAPRTRTGIFAIAVGLVGAAILL